MLLLVRLISETMKEYADGFYQLFLLVKLQVLLLIVMAHGNVSPAVLPLAEARPGWKVLRVLGNFLDLPDFSILVVNKFVMRYNR